MSEKFRIKAHDKFSKNWCICSRWGKKELLFKEVMEWSLGVDGGGWGVVCSVTQLCPTLCDPMDCSIPGSSVHGIFQAGIQEWVDIPPPGDLPNPGTELESPASPALQGDYCWATTEAWGMGRSGKMKELWTWLQHLTLWFADSWRFTGDKRSFTT